MSFGLVNVPVKLYSAKSERPVRFHQLDGRNGARVRQKRVNELTGDEVDYADIVKGYEISKGNYVLITDDELAELAADATHRLDLECFVGLDEIDAQLVLAARLVEGKPAPHANAEPVLGFEADVAVRVPEAGAPHGGAVVLEGEVPVAGAVALEVRDLAFDPDLGEPALEELLDLSRQLGDGERARRLQQRVEHRDLTGHPALTPEDTEREPEFGSRS